jgi:hypothetical protein
MGVDRKQYVVENRLNLERFPIGDGRGNADDKEIYDDNCQLDGTTWVGFLHNVWRIQDNRLYICYFPAIQKRHRPHSPDKIPESTRFSYLLKLKKI